MTCYTCNRIEMIKNDTFPFFVYELDKTYVVLNDQQYFEGYTKLLYKDHIRLLSELNNDDLDSLFNDIKIVHKAIVNVFNNENIDIEILSNNEHLTIHLIPRVEGDVPKNGPALSLHKSILFNNYNMLDKDSAKPIVSKLKEEIKRIISI